MSQEAFSPLPRPGHLKMCEHCVEYDSHARILRIPCCRSEMAEGILYDKLVFRNEEGKVDCHGFHSHFSAKKWNFPRS